jgi:GNAT superfamily N-acetyltransferase
VIDPVVRDAVADDRDELTALEAAAREALADQRGGVRWLEEHPPHAPDWATGTAGASAGASAGAVLVAELDGMPVGYLVMRADGPVVRVVDVYVRPEARELGFGDELLAAALARARAGGATWFEAEALPGDRETKNLYERAGITARLIVVSTRLDA